MQSSVKHLDHLNMSVASFDESATWYGRVFGFEVVERGVQNGRPWGVLRAGDALLCIYEQPDLAPADDDDGKRHAIYHFGLRITDANAWRRTIDEERLTVRYGGPIDWPHSTSWYVTDPSGHEIEVAAWHDDRAAFPGAA